MIEHDVIYYLKSDATLLGYLGGDASDCRIYPILAGQELTAPYMTFLSMVGTLDENLDEDRIQLNINAGNNKALLNNIRDRIKYILDRQDDIEDLMTSSDYWIYYSKLTGSMQYIDKDLNEYIEVMFFNIKYRRKQI